MTDTLDSATAEAARLIARADALVIAAGAGMGVDSGLPDFRGNEGFWRAYPALANARLDFMQVASPETFHRDPALAWGFYGHRLTLCRDTSPHEGFSILQGIGERMAHGTFVFTSNVDGQFQKARYAEDALLECHGSIHHLQCTVPCSDAIWPADSLAPSIDDTTCRWRGALPTCPHCGALARPNILMFGDGAWLADRSDAQERRLAAWLRRAKKPVVIELGAGTHVPSVRRFSEQLRLTHDAALVRINPRESDVPRSRAVGVAANGLAGVRAIAARLDGP